MLKPSVLPHSAVCKPELRLHINLLPISLALLRTPLGRTLKYLLCLTSPDMVFGNGQEKDRRSQEESTQHISVPLGMWCSTTCGCSRHFRRVLRESESELFQLESHKVWKMTLSWLYPGWEDISLKSGGPRNYNFLSKLIFFSIIRKGAKIPTGKHNSEPSATEREALISFKRIKCFNTVWDY